jgi:hypothetical protein
MFLKQILPSPDLQRGRERFFHLQASFFWTIRPRLPLFWLRHGFNIMSENIPQFSGSSAHRHTAISVSVRHNSQQRAISTKKQWL